jgi:hypothetical protein
MCLSPPYSDCSHTPLAARLSRDVGFVKQAQGYCAHNTIRLPSRASADVTLSTTVKWERVVIA